VLTVSSPTVYHNIAGPAVPTVSASDPGSGIDTTTWSWNNNTTMSPSTLVQAPSISVTGSENTTYAVTVTVKDNAGNTSNTGTVNVIKDTVAPDAAPTFTVVPANPAYTPTPAWTWSLNSTAGGEATRISKYQVTDSLGKAWWSSPSWTGTAFSRKVKWPDYSTGMWPDTWTVTVWERDTAGNLSAPVASTIRVTSVLPANGAKGINAAAATFQWWTMYYKTVPRYYVLHYGYWGKGFEELGQIEVPQVTSVDPSYTLALPRKGVAYGWYVEAPDNGQRSPPLNTDYWTFATN